MDAKEYARFVDLISQIRNKIDHGLPDMLQPCGYQGHVQVQIALDTAIRRIDHLAWLDDKGMI